MSRTRRKKVNAGFIMDKICETIGISIRSRPGTTVLSKDEIIKLHSYITVVSKPEQMPLAK